MTSRFDVLVVGARCAGATLATLLARRGMQVCLVDRAEFPSDTPSTHAIQPAGVKLLKALGGADTIFSVAAHINRGVVRWDDSQLELGQLSQRLGAPMLNVRRLVLDAVLVQNAVAAGVEVRTNTVVTELLYEHGRVAGAKAGRDLVQARLVVGADGARSTVARLVGAREYAQTEPSRAFLWAYFAHARAEPDCVWLGAAGEHRIAGSFTDAGLFVVLIAPPFDHWRHQRSDRAAAYCAGLRHWPELAECVEPATRAGPIRVMSQWRGFFRQATGPGWVLVGDAGHFKDPTAAQGISDALRQAFVLAPVVAEAVREGASADERLRKWWRWRDGDAWEMYWFAHDIGTVHPPTRLARYLQRRMAADPALVLRGMEVLNRDAPPSALINPVRVFATATLGLLDGDLPHPALLFDASAMAAQHLRRRLMRVPRPGNQLFEAPLQVDVMGRQSHSPRGCRSDSSKPAA